MQTLLQLPIMIVIMANFRLLGSSRIKACVQTVAVQSLAIAAMPFLFHFEKENVRFVLFFIFTLIVKALAVPYLLNRAADNAGVNRIVEPFVGFTTSILLGAVLFGACYYIAAPLQSASIPGGATLVPGAFFTIMTGLLVIVSRKKALMQIVGYLCLENGIYALGAALAVKEPLLVEMGALLDLFVGVFIMGVAVYHISREFDHIDTDKLSELKD